MEDHNAELWFEGEKLTIYNSLVHLMQPICWSYIEFDNGEAIVDILEEDDVIRSLVHQGFNVQVHGHPSVEYKQWYITEATYWLGVELTNWWNELSA